MDILGAQIPCLQPLTFPNLIRLPFTVTSPISARLPPLLLWTTMDLGIWTLTWTKSRVLRTWTRIWRMKRTTWRPPHPQHPKWPPPAVCHFHLLPSYHQTS